MVLWPLSFGPDISKIDPLKGMKHTYRNKHANEKTCPRGFRSSYEVNSFINKADKANVDVFRRLQGEAYQRLMLNNIYIVYTINWKSNPQKSNNKRF